MKLFCLHFFTSKFIPNYTIHIFMPELLCEMLMKDPFSDYGLSNLSLGTCDEINIKQVL